MGFRDAGREGSEELTGYWLQLKDDNDNIRKIITYGSVFMYVCGRIWSEMSSKHSKLPKAHEKQ